MFKKTLLAGLAVLLMLVLVVSPAFVSAAPPEDKPVKVREVLPLGWERADQHTIMRQVGVEKGRGERGQDLAIYEMVISGLPQTMPDNKTLIDTQWYRLSDASGQEWFETGTNLFKGRVRDGRISVEDGEGQLAVWDTRIVLGGQSYEGGTASIVDDPINENYQNNTLMWQYDAYSTGKRSTANITRYLRVIEGYISELWCIPEKPDTGILLDISRQVEGGYDADIDWAVVWDANGKIIPVWVNALGMFVIDAADLADLTYPVWIDPTYDFNLTADDAWFHAYGTVYADTRTKAACDTLIDGNYASWVGQEYYPANGAYYLDRSVVAFDTSSLPDNMVITSATLSLRGYLDYSDTDFYLCVMSGMPTYPHSPPVVGDYDRAHYTADIAQTAGFSTSSGWSTEAYNIITVNRYEWVNLAGQTKFYITSDRETTGIVPTGRESVGFWQREKGTGYSPLLQVIGAVPIVVPTVTTDTVINKGETYATFRGTVVADGGEACSTRFQYDVSTAYNYNTAWQSGYITSDTFSVLLQGLSAGELYYYRAQATNSAGTGTGASLTVLTYPYYPYSFVVTPGDAQVVLAWTKGSGAQKTMIRRDTSGYPDTPTSGTQVYFDTGTSHNDNTVVNGTTYYYSAWSYTTKGGLEEYSQDRATWTAQPSAPALATVVTNAATSVGVSSANLNLSLTNLGGYGSADISFEYGTTVAYGSNTAPVTATSVGTLSEPISGLAAATLHHFRARAQNPTGWSYGVDKTFTTGDIGAPNITTNAATGVYLDSAQLNGTVTDDGDDPPVAVWFEWGLTVSYGTSTPTAGGLITGSTFYYGLSGLEPDTTYHFRAVGQNGEGVAYGADTTFTTVAPTIPTAETLDASGIGSQQATLQGQVLTDGGVEVEVSFEYGTTVAYGTTTAWVSGYHAGQTFTAVISNLAIDVEYHFRARARNAGGTGNGADNTFTTVFTAPTNFAATAISSATIILNWTKQGDQTYIKYKTDGYPIDRADGSQVYFGSGVTSSVSGLTMGTTYYFKAWSWAEGDTWAETTATAIATTLASLALGEEAPPPEAMLEPPETPESWSQTPSGIKLSKIPGYTVLELARASYELPADTYYFALAMLITMIAVILGLLLSKQLVVGILAGAFAVVITSWLGMMSGFMVLVYVLLAGGVTFLLSRRGSEI